MNELDMNNEKHRLRLPLTSFCKKKGRRALRLIRVLDRVGVLEEGARGRRISRVRWRARSDDAAGLKCCKMFSKIKIYLLTEFSKFSAASARTEASSLNEC